MCLEQMHLKQILLLRIYIKISINILILYKSISKLSSTRNESGFTLSDGLHDFSSTKWPKDTWGHFTEVWRNVDFFLDFVKIILYNK